MVAGRSFLPANSQRVIPVINSMKATCFGFSIMMLASTAGLACDGTFKSELQP